MSLFQQGMSGVTEESMKAAESNLIPAGDYNVQCEKCEMKTNENSGSKSISMMMKILGPTQTGRVFFQNIYCFSQNESHNKKQFDKLGVFATRAGIEADEVPKMDLGDFVGLKAGCRLKIQKGSEGYDDKNEISHFKKWMDEISNAAQTQNASQDAGADIPF